jgi:hypothetical protein
MEGLSYEAIAGQTGVSASRVRWISEATDQRVRTWVDETMKQHWAEKEVIRIRTSLHFRMGELRYPRRAKGRGR